MKTLFLLRHTKSAWDDAGVRDFDRPLNARGRRAARIIGEALQDAGLAFDLVIASPAARVSETLDGLEQGYGRKIEARVDERAYLASAETLLEIIREVGAEAERLLIIGHNPGMHRLALQLTEDDVSGPRPSLREKYPTASLVEIGLPALTWSEAGDESGTLLRFLRPRDLDPEMAADADD